MQRKFRFIGLRPFETDENKLFFEREEAVNQIFKSISLKRITLIHANAGIGKTSIIKAGAIPRLNKNTNNKTFYLSVANYMKKSSLNIFEQINKIIDNDIPQNSYLDKIIEPEETLWYKFKRIEATSNTNLILIIDQFENIFSYDETQTSVLRNELHALLYDQIPPRLRDCINNKLEKNPNTLSQIGLKKLYETVNIKLVFIIRTDKLNRLDYFNDKIYLLENIIEISPITAENAKKILTNTAEFTHKYNIDNNLISNPFSICNKLTNKIIHFLTKNNQQHIETYQLQIIGKEIEKISYEQKKQEITLDDLKNFEDIYKDYYETIIKRIKDSEQQIAARKFIEDQLIFEYERRKITIYKGIALKKYNLNEETLKYLVDNYLIIIIRNKNNEIFYEISHDALITPILLAKNKRIKYEIRVQKELLEKKNIEKQAILQKVKTIKNKRIAILFSILFAVALLAGIFAKIQSNKATQNKIFAESSLFASYSFNYLNIDPTKSFRLAQKSYAIDNTNFIALKALITSFYNTNIFYSITDSITHNFDNAFFNKSGNKYLTISYEEDCTTVQLFNKSGKITNIDSLKKISHVHFFNNDSMLLISTKIDGKIHIFDTLGTKINEFEHGAFVNHATLSKNEQKIITCGEDGFAKIWDLNGNLLLETEHSSSVQYADFSHSGNFFATVNFDNRISIFNSNGELINYYEHESDHLYDASQINYIDFSPDDKNIVFNLTNEVGNTFQIKVLNISTNQITYTNYNFLSFLENVKFIDNETIIAFTKKGRAKIININTNNIKELIGHEDEITDAIYNANNQAITTISKDKTIRTWKIYFPDFDFMNYNNKSIVKFSNSGSYIALSNNNIEVIDLLGKTLFQLNSIWADNIFFSSKDNYILAYSDTVLYINNIKTNQTVIKTENDPIKYAYFDETNSKIHLISQKQIKTLSDTGKVLKNISLNYNINSACMLYNQFFVTTADQILKLNTNGNSSDSLPIPNIISIKTSSIDNFQIIAFSSQKLYILDEKFEIKHQINTNTNITCADISNNNNYFAYGNNLGDCFLLDKSGNEIINFKQSGSILKVEFSPNEKLIIVVFKYNQIETRIKSYIISPDEINKFVDKLNLYGNVENFIFNEII